MRPLREESDWVPVKNGDLITDAHKEQVSMSLKKGFVRGGEPLDDATINHVSYVGVARRAITCDFCTSCKNGLVCGSQPVRVIVCGTCSRRFLDISGEEGGAQLVEVPQRCQGFNWERTMRYTRWNCDICDPRVIGQMLDENYGVP